MKRTAIGLLALLAWIALAGCAGGLLGQTATPTPSETPRPTATPSRTPTPSDTPTPAPTRTPQPTVESTSTGPPGAAGTPVSLVLRMHLEPGDEFRVRFRTEQLITQSLQGQSFDTEQRIGYEYNYTARSVDTAGNTWVDVVYTWVYLEQETILGSLFYDSANPPAEVPAGAEGFSALVGSGFSMLLTPQGKVLELDGLEAMYEHMLQAMTFPDQATEDLFRQTIQQQFGEEALQQQMSGASFEFPLEPIQVGDSWTAVTELSALMPMIVESTYTLRSVDGTTAVVEVDSHIRANPDAEPLVFGSATIAYSLSGEQQGLVRVDLASGLSNSQVLQQLSGEMAIAAEGETIKVPVTISGQVEVESRPTGP